MRCFFLTFASILILFNTFSNWFWRHGTFSRILYFVYSYIFGNKCQCFPFHSFTGRREFCIFHFITLIRSLHICSKLFLKCDFHLNKYDYTMPYCQTHLLTRYLRAFSHLFRTVYRCFNASNLFKSSYRIQIIFI